MRAVTLVALCTLALLCICFSGLAKGQSPGLTTTITQNGLNYAKTVALELLARRLNTVKLPNQSGKKDTLKYDVTNIVFSNIKVPAATLALQNGALLVSIQGFSGEIEADWKATEVHWPHPSGHGRVKAVWDGTVITALLGFGINGGRPSVSALQTLCHVNKFHVSVHGSGILGVVAEVLTWLFQGSLKGIAQDALKSGVHNGINNELNHLLQTYPLSVHVTNTVGFNSTMVPAGLFLDSTSLSVSVNGKFLDTANPADIPPYPPRPIPRLLSNTQMVQLIFGDWAPDSASWIFNHQGKLNFSIGEAQMKSAPLPFSSTANFVHVAPGLPSKFPNLPLFATVGPSPNNPPTVTFSSSGVTTTLVFGFDLYVVNGAAKINVIDFRLTITASGTVAVNAGVVFPRLTFLGLKIDVLNTVVGPVDVAAINDEMKYVANSIILPYVNGGLATGVKIPMVDGVQLTDPTVMYGDGWLGIATNMVYHF
eukprot:TRINITY_DN580_c0_g1_i1.p1 TRINITY_DN580_c0_g1~~TRINITY_DN580_c0_g1_i1.p1  ORF type:complete len:482 (-),score=127.94 TRINITY_DN580_c0_g1_i1:101-1546(-)